MKILFSADWHIKLGQKNVPLNWARARYDSFFHQIHILEDDADLHIIGGDLFDRVPTIDELELLKITINNSLVGLSKLLHFINPVDYAIWDSRIYRYTTDKKSSYGIGNTQLYLNYLSKLNEIESHVDFNEIKKNISAHFDYEISSKRVIELLMFEADKRDNKKLI